MKIDEVITANNPNKVVKCIRGNNSFTVGQIYPYRIQQTPEGLLYKVVVDYYGGYIRMPREIFEYYFDIIKRERKEKLKKLM